MDVRDPACPAWRRGAVGVLLALLVSSVVATNGWSTQAVASPETSKFVALAPARVLDGRIGLGYSGATPPGGTVELSMLGHGGVPTSGVEAVLLNVTLADAQGPGFVQVFPTAMAAVGASSNLNVEHAGQTIPNTVIVPLGVGGSVSIYTQGGGHVIADVFGYFAQSGSTRDGRYVSVLPKRLLDTRSEPSRKLPAGGSVRVQVAGLNGVPKDGTAAAVLNVTATQATDAGYVQVLPSGTAVGGYSNLNVVANQTIPNLVVVPVGADGSVTVFSERGTHVIVDVFGYFTNDAAPETTDGLFVTLNPTRLMDTRGGAMPVGESVTDVAPRGRAGIPAAHVAAVFGNVTATDSTGTGYVQVTPGPVSAAPAGIWSNVNIERPHQTIANAAIANLGDDGALLLYSSNATHLIFDTSGYFTGSQSPQPPPPVSTTLPTTTAPTTTGPPVTTAPTTTTSPTTTTPPTTTTSPTTTTPPTTTTSPTTTTPPTTTGPGTGKACIISLHGKGGGGQSEWTGSDGVRHSFPAGNAPGWGGLQWLYFPESNYQVVRTTLANDVEAGGCRRVIIKGFSNGASFAAKLYCRGETFGGTVVGYIVDDPVVDHAVEGCAPAPVKVVLYWTGGIDVPDGWDCGDWTCEGGSTIGIARYEAEVGVARTQSIHTTHLMYVDPPELHSWL